LSSDADISLLLEVEQLDGLLDAAGPEGVKAILEAFWRSTDDLLSKLRTQIAENDYAAIAASAHAIKGSSSNIGAIALANHARDLEKNAKCADQAGLLESIDEADATYSRTRSAFDSLLARVA
jgi:HPt (histidine-containing phosphotransfer) domain-containing protein